MSYKHTRADLVKSCPLLAKIEVMGAGKTERLVGRNHAGEIVVQTEPGKVTPAKTEKFIADYYRAVQIGAVKPPKETNVQTQE